MTTTIFLGACALLAAGGIAAAAYARPRMSKSTTAAISFALPALAFIAAALLVLPDGGMAAMPLAVVGGLCLSAAAIFVPTKHSRFRDFERRFWAHVTHHVHHSAD